MALTVLLHLARLLGVIFAPLLHLGTLVVTEHGGGFLTATAIATNLVHLLELLIGDTELLLHALLVGLVTLLAIAVGPGSGDGGIERQGADKCSKNGNVFHGQSPVCLLNTANLTSDCRKSPQHCGKEV
jgi:hypothetical protein